LLLIKVGTRLKVGYPPNEVKGLSLVEGRDWLWITITYSFHASIKNTPAIGLGN